MNNREKPNLVVIAGPNGAGKSTVADYLLANKSIDTYINADVIARGIAASSRAGPELSLSGSLCDINILI